MSSILAISYGLIQILGVIAAIYAVLWARTSQGATAWAVALVTMPLISLPLFLIFGGRSFHGYVSRRRNSDSRLEAEWKQFESFFARARCFARGEHPAVDAFERLADTPFMRARSVRLLKDGEDFFPAVKEALGKAKAFADIQFYTFRDDRIGTEIAEILIQKARDGVRVRVLYDTIGSNQTPEAFFKRMREAGAEVQGFVSTRWRWRRPRFQINFRNHRKLVNVDNDVLFVGGLNVGDDYLSRHQAVGYWRDTAVQIEGCIATQAQYNFLSDWYWSTRNVIDFKPEHLQSPPKEGGIPTLILATGPTDTREEGSLAVLNAIHSAKKRVWITTPYFVPDEQVVSALQLAVLRGVNVKVLVTEITDNKLPQLASYTYYDELIPFGVEIYRYMRGLMHQKVMLVDEAFTYVGSTNFDNRSFRLNFEMGAWMCDEDFAREIEAMLLDDLNSCELVTSEMIRKMPMLRKLLSGFARLLAPIL